MTRDLKRNCLNSTKTLLRTDLLIAIAINHARLLATTLDDNVSRARREKLVAAIACCLLRSSLCELDLRWSSDCFVVHSQSQLLQNQHLSTETVLNSCNRIRCWSFLSHSQLWLDLDWMSVSLIEFEILIVFLILTCIAFVRLLDRVLLLRSSFDRLLRMFLIFWLLMFWISSKTIEIVVFELSIDDLIKKIHFAWKLRQAAQTFSIDLMFLTRRYCYE